jgi:hypothetical protein
MMRTGRAISAGHAVGRTLIETSKWCRSISGIAASMAMPQAAVGRASAWRKL